MVNGPVSGLTHLQRALQLLCAGAFGDVDLANLLGCADWEGHEYSAGGRAKQESAEAAGFEKMMNEGE